MDKDMQGYARICKGIYEGNIRILKVCKGTN